MYIDVICCVHVVGVWEGSNTQEGSCREVDWVNISERCWADSADWCMGAGPEAGD